LTAGLYTAFTTTRYTNRQPLPFFSFYPSLPSPISLPSLPCPLSFSLSSPSFPYLLFLPSPLLSLPPSLAYLRLSLPSPSLSLPLSVKSSQKGLGVLCKAHGTRPKFCAQERVPCRISHQKLGLGVVRSGTSFLCVWCAKLGPEFLVRDSGTSSWVDNLDRVSWA